MKIYKINEGESKNIVSFDKISIEYEGNKITDILLKDGRSVCDVFHLRDKGRIYYITENYGNYKEEKHLILEISLTVGDVRNVILVSSYTGETIKNQNNNSPYLLSCRYIVDHNLNFGEKWENLKIIELTNTNRKSTFIDYSGNFIIGKKEWFSDISYFYNNMYILSYGKNRWIYDTKEYKYITDASYEKIEKCPDNKHAIVKRQYGYNIIDFDGNIIFKEFYNNIEAGKLSFDANPTYYYIIYGTDTILLDENFKEVINFTKENLTFRVSTKTYSEHIVLINTQTKFNILGSNLKPISDRWFDSIDYDTFKSSLLFLVGLDGRYMIIDGQIMKPYEKCKMWVDDIIPLESLSYHTINFFAVKVKDNKCFVLKMSAYSVNIGNHCEDIEEDENGTIYLRNKSGNKIIKLWTKIGIFIFDGDALYDTYHEGTSIVKKNGKCNFIKVNGDNEISYYFKDGEWLDDVYCIDDRFVIIKRNNLYNYFDTSRFEETSILMNSQYPVGWWKDAEPAEEKANGEWIFRVMNDENEWIDLSSLSNRIIRDTTTVAKNHLKESYNPDFNDIPAESMLENPEMYKGVPVYSRYAYFGDCRNTVDIDHIWDTTEMSNWISTKCKIINPELVLDRIADGDRKIPKKALKIIEKLSEENKLGNLSDIICALDDYQKIMFIYLPETDIHYFFDCVR